MFFYKKMDLVGNLIALLRTVDDDIHYLTSVGAKPKVSDYPKLEEKVFNLLFTVDGNFTQHIKRVEQAGYYVCKVDQKVYLKMATTGYVFVFDFPQHRKLHRSPIIQSGWLMKSNAHEVV